MQKTTIIQQREKKDHRESNIELLRLIAMEIDKLMQYRDRRDLIFIYHILTHGKGRYFNQEFGTYRVHQGGVWSSIIKSHDSTYSREYLGRRCIYDVEKSSDAARLLIWPLIVLNYSRSFLLKRKKILLGTITPFIRHFGISKFLTIIFRRFVLNKFGHDEFVKKICK